MKWQTLAPINMQWQMECGLVYEGLLTTVILVSVMSIALHSNILFVLILHQFSFPTPAIPWVSITIVTRLLNLANGSFSSPFSFPQPLSQNWFVDSRHHPRRYAPLPIRIKTRWDPQRNIHLDLCVLSHKTNTKPRIINKEPIYSMDVMW